MKPLRSARSSWEEYGERVPRGATQARPSSKRAWEYQHHRDEGRWDFAVWDRLGEGRRAIALYVERKVVAYADASFTERVAKDHPVSVGRTCPEKWRSESGKGYVGPKIPYGAQMLGLRLSSSGELRRSKAEWTDAVIYDVEGPKDADALIARAGVEATTWQAHVVNGRIAKLLLDIKRVCIVADLDGAGLGHARKKKLAYRAAGIFARIYVPDPELFEEPWKKDVTDLLDVLQERGESFDPEAHLLQLTDELAARIEGFEPEPPVLASDEVVSAASLVTTGGVLTGPWWERDAILVDHVAGDLHRTALVCFTDAFGWMEWTGAVWEVVGKERITELVRQHMVKLHIEQIASATRRDERDALVGLLAERRIAALVRLLSGNLLRKSGDFIPPAHLFNFPNGVYDMRAGRLVGHNPDHGFMWVAGVEYDECARSNAWEAIKTSLPQESRAYLMARLGQAATGYTPGENAAVLVLVGDGENAKNTFLLPVVRAFGGAAVRPRPEILMSTRGQHPEVFMSLHGKRLAWLDETEDDYLDENHLKRVVNESITARQMYGREVTFPSTHSWLLSTNHPPRVKGSARATWRRLAQIRFPYVFGNLSDPTFVAKHGEFARQGNPKLKRLAERSNKVAVAAMGEVMAEAHAWFERGMDLPPMPSSVLRATEAWRGENDLIGDFLNGRIVADPERFIPLTDLLAAYNEHLDDRGHRPVSVQTAERLIAQHEHLAKWVPGIKRFDVGRKRKTAREASLRRQVPREPGRRASLEKCWLGVAWDRSE